MEPVLRPEPAFAEVSDVDEAELFFAGGCTALPDVELALPLTSFLLLPFILDCAAGEIDAVEPPITPEFVCAKAAADSSSPPANAALNKFDFKISSYFVASLPPVPGPFGDAVSALLEDP
jgi:hypothetical protein